MQPFCPALKGISREWMDFQGFFARSPKKFLISVFFVLRFTPNVLGFHFAVHGEQGGGT